MKIRAIEKVPNQYAPTMPVPQCLWVLTTLQVGKSYAILFVGLAYQDKDIMFRLLIEYTSLRDFGS
jgi:hypothetical protein